MECCLIPVIRLLAEKNWSCYIGCRYGWGYEGVWLQYNNSRIEISKNEPRSVVLHLGLMK